MLRFRRVAKGTRLGSAVMVALTFGVATTPARAAEPPPPGTPAQPPASLVLISNNPVKLSRAGRAEVGLTCSGTAPCAGVVSLTTATRVRVARRQAILRLGSTGFAIDPGARVTISLRVARSKVRIARAFRHLDVVAKVRDHDLSGRARTCSMKLRLKVP
jgi:hypothetical protein